jgi:hypothetical protein
MRLAGFCALIASAVAGGFGLVAAAAMAATSAAATAAARLIAVTFTFAGGRIARVAGRRSVVGRIILRFADKFVL